MNPLLLKPEADTRSQVVLLGRVNAELTALPWRTRCAQVWPMLAQTLDALRREYDVIVIEGAGSPAEINLQSSDVVNLRVARHADAACLLVSDIDRGGAFAHLYGTWALIPEDDRRRLKGFVLNRFRGDPGLLAPAPERMLELTGVRADHQLSPNTRLDAKFGQSSISNTWNYTNNVATWDKTRLREYGLGATQQVTPEVLARVGAERLEESYDTTGLSSPTRTTHALTGNAVGEYGPHQLNVALRLDDSNRYKKTFSHQVGYGYRLAGNLRVVGNLNTGYRMPDLADYYASPENARLKQQRNQTVDAGAYWQPDQATYAKAIVYRSRVRDRLTTIGDCTGAANCAITNVGRATITGIALSLGQENAPGQLVEGLRWQANLDLVNPKNSATGRVLPHVAKRTVSGQVDYSFDEYSVGADVVLNNRHFSDEANQRRVGGGLLVNLRSSWRVSPELTAHADVYNLGNRSNASWRYYNQQPRTVMLGVSYSPR